ncbi:helix-turn-helix domain-containing protein [Nocardioides marmoraquaticus]
MRTQRQAARQAAATGGKVATAEGGWAWVPPDEEHDWIGVAEAAAIIGVTPQAITYRCRTGTIPATKLGPKWWIQAEHARIAANVRATSGPEDIVTTRPPDTD